MGPKLIVWLTMSKPDLIWPSTRLIRAARAMVGIDQETLAKQAGVTRKTVVKIEADQKETMDPRRLKALSALSRVFEEIYDVEFFAGSDQTGEGVRFKRMQE
jgi:DNA-binding XRE family transcriptional regulator